MQRFSLTHSLTVILSFLLFFSIAFAHPALIPTPKPSLPPAPTPTETLIETPTVPSALGPLLDVPSSPSEISPPISEAQALQAEAFAAAFPVLYDQTDYPMYPPFAAISSQNFEPQFNAFDAQAADDFEVPAGVSGWGIRMVEIKGYYVGGGARNATSVNIWFYADAGGLPGDQVYAALGVIPSSGLDTGRFVIDLPTAALLEPGRYWVSVQANLDLLPDNRQWAWQKRIVQNGYESAFRNPGDGFGTGCKDWGARVTTCGSVGGPDLLFRLGGASAPPATTSVYGVV